MNWPLESTSITLLTLVIRFVRGGNYWTPELVGRAKCRRLVVWYRVVKGMCVLFGSFLMFSIQLLPIRFTHPNTTQRMYCCINKCATTGWRIIPLSLGDCEDEKCVFVGFLSVLTFVHHWLWSSWRSSQLAPPYLKGITDILEYFRFILILKYIILIIQCGPLFLFQKS